MRRLALPKDFWRWNKEVAALRTVFSDRYEGTIYHYTSFEGMRGIIENREIWLTNTAFVNDVTECKALKTVDDSFGKEFTNKYVRDAFERLREQDPEPNYYIASFSKAPNSLPQWRAYGDFCIGFEADKLANDNSDLYHSGLYECVYAANKIKDWMIKKQKLKQWEKCLDSSKITAAKNLVFAASVKYKSSHYEDEKEFRLIVVYPESMQKEVYRDADRPLKVWFRDHPVYKVPVPYVKFFISEGDKDNSRSLLPITSLTIGPMLYQKEARVACGILLKKNGYDVQPETSEIPYRGF